MSGDPMYSQEGVAASPSPPSSEGFEFSKNYREQFKVHHFLAHPFILSLHIYIYIFTCMCVCIDRALLGSCSVSCTFPSLFWTLSFAVHSSFGYTFSFTDSTVEELADSPA